MVLQLIKEHKKPIAIAGVALIGIVSYVISIFFDEEGEITDLNLQSNVMASIQEETVVEAEDSEIMVDVKGAVKYPGVYKGESGDRAIDMIEKAGGLIEGANSDAVNFAMKMTDEMVLYVPFEGEEANFVTGRAGVDDGKININTASETELQTLPGIGPAKAQAIIEYRTNQGSFQTIEEIMNIGGFGEKTFAKLKEHIKVK